MESENSVNIFPRYDKYFYYFLVLDELTFKVLEKLWNCFELEIIGWVAKFDVNGIDGLSPWNSCSLD